MSFFSNEDLLELLESAGKYNKSLTSPAIAPVYPTSGKLSFNDAAEILRTKGWPQPEGITDEQLVMGYIFPSDTATFKGKPLTDRTRIERAQYRHILSEEIPIELDPDYEPGLAEVGYQSVKKYANNLYAAVPGILTGALQDATQFMDELFAINKINWKEVGSSLWNANPDGVLHELNRAQREHNAEMKRIPGAYIGRGKNKMINLDGIEDFFHVRAAERFEEHNKDPRWKAYQGWVEKLTKKDLLPFTNNPMGFKEKLAYLEHNMASPLFSTGLGLATLAFTRNPKLAMKTAQTSAFFMEASDEYEQSMEHWTSLGFSPENAGRMGHAGVMMYGAGAYYFERIPWSRAMPKELKVAAKRQWWDGFKRAATKRINNLPGIEGMKTVSNFRVTKALTN